MDQEAEEEARRLQEEIAASRLEREKRRASNRRSAGIALQSPSSATMLDCESPWPRHVHVSPLSR